MPDMDRQKQIQYSRHLLLPDVDEAGQSRLLNASVLVIGMGGLGCPVSQYLCTSGIGQMTLMDDDAVELSNLPRQILFHESDIGRSKVQVAAEKLQQLNPDCNISSIPQRAAAETLEALTEPFDLILDCTDNLSSRLDINRYAVERNIPLIIAAAIRLEGQLAAFQNSGNGPCYQCLFGKRDADNEGELCTEAGVLSTNVGLMGLQQANLALKALLGIGEVYHQYWMLDQRQGTQQTMQIMPNPECPVCQG